MNDLHHESETHELGQKSQEFKSLQPAYQKLKNSLNENWNYNEDKVGFIRLSDLHLKSEVKNVRFEVALLPCMDEGGQNSSIYSYIQNLSMINLGTPGSFVLEKNPEERNRRLDLFNKFLNTYGITKVVVMPHISCAAAEKSLGDPIHSKEDVTNQAKLAGDKLEGELLSRNPTLSTDVEFIDHLHRNEYHNALAANLYLVNSRSLITRYPRVSELALREETQVPAFNNFAIIENEDDIQNAAFATDLAVNIAFGDHGFGKDRFTKEDPFLVNIYVASREEGDNAVDVIHFINDQRPDAENIRYSIIYLTN